MVVVVGVQMRLHGTSSEAIVEPSKDIPFDDGRRRVTITSVTPEIGGGRYPIKRTAGQDVTVTATAFADGHELVRCVLRHRAQHGDDWSEQFMRPLGNDQWQAVFPVNKIGRYRYTVQSWVDRFQTWSRDLRKRVEALQHGRADLLIGAQLVRDAQRRAPEADADRLKGFAAALEREGDLAAQVDMALAGELSELMDRYADRGRQTTYHRELVVVVDRPLARCGAWYEMFPRSCADTPGEHGTFRDCVRRLPYVASMGFDVLYLPPIHPIGRTHRKGKNNTVECGANDLGSPWAIGSAEGGHKAIHPQLGTLADFRCLVEQARRQGLEVALDLAFQCSPDHPYVRDHPEWFRKRPDGTIQYAENPPKKYQDIIPIDFETPRWRELWDELRSVVSFWIDQGVRIFRVDNPHTKPFAFWEWLIGETQREHPDVIFLAEAFTRPSVMYELARCGFTQSYTYFPWRTTRQELTDYFTELTQSEIREVLRPSAWTNTPDILIEYLQIGGRAAFAARLVLAATLSANYGIYGPAFELCEREALQPGSEEYLNSEKYEMRTWDLARPGNLAGLITRVNRIRRENPALQSDGSLAFHPTTNEQLICYSKREGENVIVVVVNLDPHHAHSGWIELPPERLGVATDSRFQVHDLLADARYLWYGPRNYVELHPDVSPAHIFCVRRWLRTERDFEYYL
ncbi:MAG TPA: alpha-1,4-glucan--maltose-1-phosphate maltosyltransferase [Pirellulales bacterium]|nr:alpha-1,4-glucan--maltose-1-phosphate maltosyltransferase [Pirellulales bacterium]